jgi:hypothetical protein
MRYFKKELPTNPLSLPDGRKIHFLYNDPNDYGWFRTEDGYYIAELDNAINRRVGGVLNSDEAEYAAFEQKKSESPSTSSPRRERELLSAQMFHSLRNQKVQVLGAGAEAAGAGVAKPPPPPPQPLQVVDRFPLLGTAGKKS